MPKLADPHVVQSYWYAQFPCKILSKIEWCGQAFKRINPQRCHFPVDWLTWQSFGESKELIAHAPVLCLVQSTIACNPSGGCVWCWHWWNALAEWPTSGILLQHSNRNWTEIRCDWKGMSCYLLGVWEMGQSPLWKVRYHSRNGSSATWEYLQETSQQSTTATSSHAHETPTMVLCSEV